MLKWKEVDEAAKQIQGYGDLRPGYLGEDDAAISGPPINRSQAARRAAQKGKPLFDTTYDDDSGQVTTTQRRA